MQKLILFSLAIIFVGSEARATGMVVTDPGTYNYLSGIDKKTQQQVEFSQKLQEANLTMKDSLIGNKNMGYGINNSANLLDDYFNLALVINPNNKALNAQRAIESIFSEKGNAAKKEYQQKALKTALIIGEMVANNAKARGQEITSLSSSIDSTTKLKEAIDVQNRISLEILLELRNTNLLLANLLKSTASQSFQGNLIESETDKEQVKDYFTGNDEMSRRIINRPSSGTFSRMGR